MRELLISSSFYHLSLQPLQIRKVFIRRSRTITTIHCLKVHIVFGISLIPTSEHGHRVHARPTNLMTPKKLPSSIYMSPRENNETRDQSPGRSIIERKTLRTHVYGKTLMIVLYYIFKLYLTC